MNQDSQMALSCFHYDSYSVNVFQCKKSTLPENAQDSTIYYYTAILKTSKKKLDITVFSGGI